MVNAADFSYYMTDYLAVFRWALYPLCFDDGTRKTLLYNSTVTVNDSVLVLF